MKPFGSRVIVPTLFAAMVALGSSAPAHSQEGEGRAEPTAPQPVGAGAAPGGPPGRGNTPSMEDGPWELDTEEGRVRVTAVSTELERPWALVFLPDEDGLLITERPGRLRVMREGILDPRPIEGLPDIRAAVIGGLLDIALHPEFEQNRLIYFAYSKPDSDEPSVATLAVARARWDGGYSLEDVEDVFVANEWYGPEMAGTVERCCGQGPADGSYGSRIVFDEDGLLYIAVGDRNWGEKAQDPASHLGKIVRIRDDGSIPEDNPFLDDDDYLPDIYTLGHRNPTGLVFHPVTNELWSTEFGPRGGDELNLIEAGKNYGWILVTPGEHYNNQPPVLGHHDVPGMEDPVLYWTPAINPGNLLFYYGELFPQWEGDMLMAAKAQTLLRVRFDDDGEPVHQERMLTELGQRIRDVRQGPDGFIYLLTDETAGAMLRIEPVDGAGGG